VDAGLEYTFMQVFSLRVGYAYSAAASNLVGMTGLTAGAGLKLGGFVIDYAYVPFGDLGTTQMVTIGYIFGGGGGAALEKKPENNTKAPAGGKKGTAPLDAVDLYNQGAVLENSGQLEQALAKYKAALKLNSRYAPALKRAGIIYYKQNNTASALKYFKMYVNIVPDDDQINLLIVKLENQW
jgi:hypothetical protein